MNTDNKQELRWVLRLSNYEKALDCLSAAVELSKTRSLSDLEKQGLIQAFEFTHELAWNVMKDYFNYQGTQDITGSRDATREAYSKGLVQDGEGWMAMIQSRNKTSHTYNQAVANEIVDAIKDTYFNLFKEFLHKFLILKSNLA
jgi:nucleotidyltransferase substrate binding protein (TIGR01987 family)